MAHAGISSRALYLSNVYLYEYDPYNQDFPYLLFYLTNFQFSFTFSRPPGGPTTIYHRGHNILQAILH